ncbi:hypothetical protein Daus18300_002429 [Diaporthe australafricana]|uniref:Sodium/calcium exchanger membrane region domain-containing protein n=1 Tax=Diaporthe australafricana TaxID=127596 RepID=A0ABR3XN84_9PEZI
MADYDTLFHIAAFLAGLSLLERGAKLFVESATTLAKRLRLPEVLVAILIAGAEWEELAVVSLSLAQERPALAVGNVIGSSVANILGAFALGLVFSTGTWEGFDRTSKLATQGLLALTTVVALFALADIVFNRIVAGMLLATFVLYILLVLWTIWQAMFYTEEHEERDDVESGAAAHDDASSSSSSSDSSSGGGHVHHFLDRHRHFVDRHILHRNRGEEPNETTTLLGMPAPGYTPKKFHHTLGPALQVLGGFAALTLSGFILSRTSIHLASTLNMSDSAFGATFLSLATTLPEKFLAVMSSSQGHTGLLVADAVGSNVFLLTLCLGIAAWSIGSHDWHDHQDDGGLGQVDIARIEAWWLWTASIVLAFIVNVGGKLFCKFAVLRQVLGVMMLMGYGGFLAIEFTVLRAE